MKKFISFLCALTLVLSVNAVPQKKVVYPMDQHSRMEKKIDIQDLPTVKRAPKALLADSTVEISEVSSTYYSFMGAVRYSLKTSSLIFNFYIKTTAQDIESGKEYTLADMDSTYTGWSNVGDDFVRANFNAVSFTKTVAEDGSFSIKATATDIKGNNWTLNYSEAAFVPQTYNVEMTAFTDAYDYLGEDLTATLTKTSEDLSFRFVVLLDSGVYALESGKEYTLADMDSANSYGSKGNTAIIYASASLKKTVAADGAIAVAATVKDAKGNTWNLTYAKAAEKPEVYEVNIASMEEYNTTVVLKDSTNNTYRFAINATAIESGKEYTLADMNTTNSYATIRGDKTSYKEASFTKTVAADGAVAIEASFKTRENIIYNLHFAQAAPTTRKETLTLNGSAIAKNQVEAFNEDTTVSVLLMWKGTTFVGTAATADFHAAQSYVSFKDSAKYIMKEAAIVAAYDTVAKHYTVNGTMLAVNEKDALDQVEFTLALTITGEDPTAPETYNVVMTAYTEEYNYLSNGIIAQLHDAGENTTFHFVIKLDSGVYALTPDVVYTLADMDSANCYLTDVKKNLRSAFTAASFKKSFAADSTIAIEATVKDINGNTWNLTYAEAIDAAEQINIAVASVVENGTTVILKDSANNIFSYAINAAAIESGKTYTLAQMTVSAKLNGNTITPKEATFTKTIAADGAFSIDATFALRDENKVYNLHFAQAAASVRKDTLTLNGSALMGTYSQIEAFNADSTISLLLMLKSEELVGTWATADFFTAQSFVKDTLHTYIMQEAALTIAYDETAKLYTVNGTMLAINEKDALDKVEFTLHLAITGKAPFAPGTYNVDMASFREAYDGMSEEVIAVLADTTADLTFRFAFKLDSGVYELAAGVAYTLANMDSANSYVVDMKNNFRAAFAAASFKKTVAADGSLEVKATVEDTKGNTWNLNYLKAYVAPEEINVDIVEANEVAYTNMVYVLMVDSSNNDYRFLINAKPLESGKEYTLADMNASYCYATIRGNRVSFNEATLTKTVAADGAFTIEASFTLKDENAIYHLHYAQAAPTITEQTLTLNGEMESGSYYSYVDAFSADSTVEVYLLLNSADFVGEWTDADFWTSYSFVAFYGEEEVYYMMKEAAITTAYDETAQHYTLNGTMLTVNDADPLDQIRFTLNLTLDGQAPVQPVDLTFELQLTDTSVVVLPSNDEDAWDYYLITPEDFGVFGGTIDDLAAAIYRSYGNYYAAPGAYEFMFDQLLRQGYRGELILVVWGANERGVTTDAQSIRFTLPEVEDVTSDMTFEFTQDATGITVTPSSNDEAWDGYIVNEATFDYYGADRIAASIFAKYGTKYAAKGAQTYTWSFLKTYAVDAELQFVPGTYYFVTWGVAEYNVTTPAAYYMFELSGEEAIDNTRLNNAAAKRLINGQLIIEKNGVQYNVLGSIVK